MTTKCSICELEYQSESDHHLCFLIRHTSVNTGVTAITYTENTGRTADPRALASKIKTKNIMRQGEDPVAIEVWARFQNEDIILPTMPQMPPRFSYSLTGSGINPLTVLQQVQSRLEVQDIVGFPTPMKQLCEELRFSPSRSILDVLYKNHYSSEHAISMGVEFNMITSCADDWDVILRRKFFTPYQLCHLGFTFTRMLLAGMDLDLFSYAGMDREALHIIRFSVRAFRCARGTREQLDRILGVSEVAGLVNRYVY